MWVWMQLVRFKLAPDHICRSIPRIVKIKNPVRKPSALLMHVPLKVLFWDNFDWVCIYLIAKCSMLYMQWDAGSGHVPFKCLVLDGIPHQRCSYRVRYVYCLVSVFLAHASNQLLICRQAWLVLLHFNKVRHPRWHWYAPFWYAPFSVICRKMLFQAWCQGPLKS